MVDWRFTIELVSGPDAEYGWLNPNSDIDGSYSCIDWRSRDTKKPTEHELIAAWDNYVAQFGTPEEQERSRRNEKAAALGRLKAAAFDNNINDLLKVMGFE